MCCRADESLASCNGYGKGAARVCRHECRCREIEVVITAAAHSCPNHKAFFSRPSQTPLFILSWHSAFLLLWLHMQHALGSAHWAWLRMQALDDTCRRCVALCDALQLWQPTLLGLRLLCYASANLLLRNWFRFPAGNAAATRSLAIIIRNCPASRNKTKCWKDFLYLFEVQCGFIVHISPSSCCRNCEFFSMDVDWLSKFSSTFLCSLLKKKSLTLCTITATSMKISFGIFFKM
jgi:hypothetical protein